MHLELVLKRIEKVGLKLKPAKCKFICQEVEYLCHLITPRGFQTNEHLVKAVKAFPHPQDVTEFVTSTCPAPNKVQVRDSGRSLSKEGVM